MAPRLEERAELKCRMCGELVPTQQYSYSQKKKKHRRRCPACVAYVLYLRGDGPKPADVPVAVAEANDPEEYQQIQLAEQLLPPQQLSGVSHLKTIVVEPSASGPGQRRARSSSWSKPKSAARKSRAERDVAEENLSDDADGFKKPKNKRSRKLTHERTPSASDQARALYMSQLSGRRKIRASRDFDNEEEPPELLKGEKGRKRLSVLDGGYPRESMRPGPERIITGGH